LPFDDSRRLTGSNLFFSTTGAVLEVVGIEADDALLAGWRERVERARSRLGWSGGMDAGAVVRRHAGGVSLAITAPFDQLFTATEVNEWALCAALYLRDPGHWAGLQRTLTEAALAAGSTSAETLPPEIDEAPALTRFEQLSRAEARPHLRALVDAAELRDLPWLLDDEVFSVGEGSGGCSFSLSALPFVADVPWDRLHPVPTALVTGSNGKTTTVRLVAACLRATGRRVGSSCTDGLFVDGETIDSGDYSGPVGARTVLRDPRVEGAVLETARGGILRRGLAVARADVAVVTNISEDHFGEYGIHDLGGLADAKLTVGSVIGADGLLVLNADDALLRTRCGGLHARFGRRSPIGWFAQHADHELLRAHRAGGGMTCGVRNGCLMLHVAGVEHDLGVVSTMPLTVEGRAVYNVANLAAAALAAAGLGIGPAAIAEVFARFGSDLRDNAGRMMRFDVRGVRVLLDYAHNPEGLAGLLHVASGLRGTGGRLGLLLGHAGNRSDADIERLANVAAAARPDLVVVKELEGYLRGRAPGEVPAVIRAALLRSGLPESALPLRSSEVDAARCALDWARPCDVLLLLVHSLAARTAVVTMLEAAR